MGSTPGAHHSSRWLHSYSVRYNSSNKCCRETQTRSILTSRRDRTSRTRVTNIKPSQMKTTTVPVFWLVCRHPLTIQGSQWTSGPNQIYTSPILQNLIECKPLPTIVSLQSSMRKFLLTRSAKCLIQNQIQAADEVQVARESKLQDSRNLKGVSSRSQRECLGKRAQSVRGAVLHKSPTTINRCHRARQKTGRWSI